MKAIIFWNNGHTTNKDAYYNETVNDFKNRILKSYGKYNVPIMICNHSGEGYYIA